MLLVGVTVRVTRWCYRWCCSLVLDSGVTQWFQTDVLNTQQTTPFTLQAIGADVTFVTKTWAGGGGGSADTPAIGGGAGYQAGTYILSENGLNKKKKLYSSYISNVAASA